MQNLGGQTKSIMVFSEVAYWHSIVYKAQAAQARSRKVVRICTGIPITDSKRYLRAKVLNKLNATSP